jgi:hypothetical protein
MAIHLDDPETERRAKRLAALTDSTVAQVIASALKEKEQEFDGREHNTPEYLAWKLAWYAKLDARPRTIDPRSWREIEEQELYDEFGCPI